MKTYKKIDIYTKNFNGFYVYECSTMRYKTCKEAKKSFLLKENYLDTSQVKCSFSK